MSDQDRPVKLRHRETHTFVLPADEELDLPLTMQRALIKPDYLRAIMVTIEIVDNALQSVLAWGSLSSSLPGYTQHTQEIYRPGFDNEPTRALDEWLAAHHMPIVDQHFGPDWTYDPADPGVGLGDGVIHEACPLPEDAEVESEVTTTSVESWNAGLGAGRVLICVWLHTCTCGASKLTQSIEADPDFPADLPDHWEAHS